jgi:hypothetical protein
MPKEKLREIHRPQIIFVLWRVVAAGIVIYLFYAYLFPLLRDEAELSVLQVLGIFAIYFAASAIFNPLPDYNNMGWFGGWFDDPTQIEDDINRRLHGLKIFLLPGKIVFSALVYLKRYFID